MAGNTQIRSASSLEPFASPDQLDPKLKSFLEEASSLLCNWLAQASRSTPLPISSFTPEVRPLPNGLSSEALLADLQLVMEGSYQPSHPGALAHLDPPPLTSSIAADLICAGLNNNLLAEELSPTLSTLERMLCDWFCEKLGLPPHSGGVAASGGSLSNLMALVVARKFANLEDDPKAVFLVSEDAHVSFDKAARVMGLCSDSLQKISTQDDGQICLQALQEHLTMLRGQGRSCFAVVATAGTTVRGAVDQLPEIGEICKREGLWLHIDGAIGGIFALSNNTASIVNGMSLANSITLNPQKLLGITKTSSLLLVSKLSNLTSTFSTGLPYIEPALRQDFHGGEMGLQGTRPAEILKLWLGLRQLGENGIERLLDAAINRRRYFQDQLDFSKFKSISGPLHLISITPRDVDNTTAASWSQATRRFLLDQDFMLSRPMHSGRYYLKAVFGNPHTQRDHLNKLAYLLNQSVDS